ncbi:hypothetical protein EV356DRAFT_537049 [Viridothelium virens]|uniref:Uncharacterized protein n=1 Tax=Viridothelium virens TaxID=1048519 RepID=A0A6A6GVP2_VIRVR|nr:hypothetical protein EV356DRAFT_537049 [Viridothelium virens]
MYQHPGSQYQQPQQGYNQGQYAAPQQSAQAYGQQPPYQYPQQPYQQQYNQGYQHGLPSQGGPPNHGYGPPQKKKGHPEITRYPPPPGYRGPAAQGGPPQYPGPQGYAQSYPPQSGYGPPQNGYPPPSGYQQAPSYPHQGSPPQNWHQPQHYPAQQGYQYPSQQGYEQSGYQQPHYPGPQGYQGQPSYQDPNHQWQQQPPYPGPTPPYDPNFPPPQNGYNPQQPPYQGPNQSSYQQTGPTPPQSATTNGESKYSQNGFGSQSRAMSVTEDAGWDYDYYGEPWAKDPDTIDPNLSIGIIVWHPANRTSCALPSTFAEAEKEMAEAVKKPDNKKRRLDEQIQESVSKYFVGEDAEEALLNIRQTSEWQIVKDELIFVEFPTSCDLIPLHEVKARRDRPAMEEDPGSEMDLEDGEEPDLPKPEPPPQGDQKHWNVMDNLEQALSSSDYSTGNKSASDTTALTTPAAGPPDQKHVQPLQPVRDTAQEDILAQLGVSGSPKPVYPTPGPAYMPPRQDSPSSQNQPTPAAEEPERQALLLHLLTNFDDSLELPRWTGHILKAPAIEI